MAQLDNKFIAFWMNTTTAPWTPLIGLSATITIREADSPYTVIVNNEAMTEMWGWHYIYVFLGMIITKEYTYTCNPNATAFIESGVTNNTLYSWIQENRSGGGGGYSVNLSGVTGSISNLGKLVKEENEKLKEHITKKNNETNSHIDVAKTEVIDTIDGIEQGELDTSDIIKGIGTIKAQNTKLASYLKGEENKEKAEMEKMHKNMMDDMEKAYAEMEKENGKIIEEKEKEKSEVMKSADEIIEELEKEVSVAWENAIKEIKTLLK
jgi:hypothetical protein